MLRSTFRDGENSPPSLGTLIFKHLGPVAHISLHAASRGENRAFAEWATSGFSAPLISLDISGNDYLELSQLRRILDQTLNLKSLSIIRSQPIVPSQWLPLVHHLKLESLRLDMLNDPNIERLGTVFPTTPTLRHITFDVYPPKEDTEQQEDDSNEQLLLLILDSVKGCTLHVCTLSKHLDGVPIKDVVSRPDIVLYFSTVVPPNALSQRCERSSSYPCTYFAQTASLPD